jgi:hypothetical protein
MIRTRSNGKKPFLARGRLLARWYRTPTACVGCGGPICALDGAFCALFRHGWSIPGSATLPDPSRTGVRAVEGAALEMLYTAFVVSGVRISPCPLFERSPLRRLAFDDRPPNESAGGPDEFDRSPNESAYAAPNGSAAAESTRTGARMLQHAERRVPDVDSFTPAPFRHLSAPASAQCASPAHHAVQHLARLRVPASVRGRTRR